MCREDGEVARAFRAYREAFDLANGATPDATRVARAALGMYATKQPLGDKYVRAAIMRADVVAVGVAPNGVRGRTRR